MQSSFSTDIMISNLVHFSLIQSGILSKLGNVVNAKDVIFPIEKSIQKSGCDIIYKLEDGSSIKIDEKAQIRFINNPVPSFTLELYNSSANKFGWFLDDTLETTHYMFIWVLNSDRPYELLTSYEHIHKLRLCICNRANLQVVLSSYGYDKEELKRLALKLNSSSINRVDLERELCLIQSKQYVEAPINIKIPFDILKLNAEVCIDLDCDTKQYTAVKSW